MKSSRMGNSARGFLKIMKQHTIYGRGGKMMMGGIVDRLVLWYRTAHVCGKLEWCAAEEAAEYAIRSNAISYHIEN